MPFSVHIFQRLPLEDYTIFGNDTTDPMISQNTTPRINDSSDPADPDDSPEGVNYLGVGIFVIIVGLLSSFTFAWDFFRVKRRSFEAFRQSGGD